MNGKTHKKRHRKTKWCTARQLEDQLKALGARFLGEGRHRKVYLRKGKSRRKGKQLRRYVYKIPNPNSLWDELTVSDCVAANRREYRQFLNRNKEYKDRFARCKLLPNGVLVMEYVKEIKGGQYDPSVPPWAREWDCWQVGKDRLGRVKLYDYAE